MKPRLIRLLVLVCIAAAALGSTLLITYGGPTESRAIGQLIK